MTNPIEEINREIEETKNKRDDISCGWHQFQKDEMDGYILGLKKGLSIIEESKEGKEDLVLLPKYLTAENGAKSLLIGEMDHKAILESLGYQFDDDLYTKENTEITWKDVHEIMDKVEALNKSSIIDGIISESGKGKPSRLGNIKAAETDESNINKNIR